VLGFRCRAVGMSTIGGFWIDEAVVLYYFLPCISRDSMLGSWHRTVGGSTECELVRCGEVQNRYTSYLQSNGVKHLS
jgi:hypothetical protein